MDILEPSLIRQCERGLSLSGADFLVSDIIMDLNASDSKTSKMLASLILSNILQFAQVCSTCP